MFVLCRGDRCRLSWKWDLVSFCLEIGVEAEEESYNTSLVHRASSFFCMPHCQVIAFKGLTYLSECCVEERISSKEG